MRLTYHSIFILPCLAAFALAACSNQDDIVTDEALLAEEVMAVIDDNGLQPAPGEYATQVELIEFDAPGLADASIAEARAEFASGAETPNLYCLTEGVTRDAWLSEMVEAECTLSRFTAQGDTIDGAMACASAEGLDGRVDVAGTADADSSDLRMTYAVSTAAGDGTVRFRVTSERIGDCT